MTGPRPIVATAAIAIDPARLERATRLRAIPQGPGRYRIEGGAEPHDVDVRDPRAPVCHCRDRVKGACKHILAALICEGDPAALAAATALVAEVAA